MTPVVNAKLSPSLNQKGPAFLTDDQGNRIPVQLVVFPAVDGTTGLPTAHVKAGAVSQVTALEDAPVSVNSDGVEAPLLALMSIDPATGKPAAFQVPSATSAHAVSGKFQSTELTGTGSAQNVAHGLGVVPSMVLVSIQDTNGVALPHAVVEGVHTITNLVLTVTNNVKFKVIAFV